MSSLSLKRIVPYHKEGLVHLSLLVDLIKPTIVILDNLIFLLNEGKLRGLSDLCLPLWERHSVRSLTFGWFSGCFF